MVLWLVALTSGSLCELVNYWHAYLMILYSLAVIQDMPCIPSLTSSTVYECFVLNSMVAYLNKVYFKVCFKVHGCHFVFVHKVSIHVYVCVCPHS